MAANGAREVHVFEPLPLNLDRICKLIELNTTKSIILHTVAVGELDSEMDLLVMPETNMAKLEASAFQQKATPQQKLRVRVRRLDSILHMGEAPPPSLVKIDVEGAELRVLQGALGILRDYRPEIFVEVYSVALLELCADFLTNDGYRVERLDDDSAAVSSEDICKIRAFARPVI
jgi:FkbM family methyltransferase